MKKRLLRIAVSMLVVLILPVNAFAGDGYPICKSEKPAEQVYDYMVYAGLDFAPRTSNETLVSTDTIDEMSNERATAITAVAAASTPVYYGPSTSYAFAATLSSSRTVSVIEKVGNFYLCEYTVTNGLFRGYIYSSYLSGNLSSVPTATNSIYKYSLNVYNGSRYVYGGPNSTSYVKIGYISAREIITVLKAVNSTWYQIEYYTSSGNKRGYIEQAGISIPALTYGYCMPIFSGTRGSGDYGSNGHAGIDILVNQGTSLYSLTAGTVEYKSAYEEEERSYVMVSYGNYAWLTFNGITAIYAHMNSFANGYSALNYPNPSPPRGQSNATVVESRGSCAVSYGTLLGTSGNTGNSTTPHLHFEMREGTTVVDPFKYVLFAKMPS